MEKSIKKITGVKEASVSIMLKKAIVESEDFVSENEIRQAITNAGYKPV